ncbi:hypothetical protein ACP4OV_002329 [Aristida adscensionis]
MSTQDTSMPTRTFYTLYSGPAKYAPKERDGEAYLWRDDFDFFKDADPEAPGDSNISIEGLETEGLDDFMTQAADCLGLGRGLKLILEPQYEILGKEDKFRSQCRVPTPGKFLSVQYTDIPLGLQRRPMEEPIKDCSCSVAALRPIWESAHGSRPVPRQTSTLAQKFISQPSSRWFSNCRPQLQLEVPICRKMLLWARMMLINDEDKTIMERAGIFRGVLASLYRCHIDPSLAAAFLTYWNIDAHTVLTSQGEMGYPLHTVSDALGIPFAGRLYEEFIPLPSAVRGHVKTLQAIYASLSPVAMKPGPGLVTLVDWVNHFFDDKADSLGSLSFDGFADPEDPLLQKLDFRVETRDDRPAIILGDQFLPYRVAYPPVVYRAAFIAAWLCTYCVPVEAGHYIRAEVFVMAMKIAEGNRRAIGVTSLAYLYRCLDNVHDSIIGGARSASECSLFVPGHFLMGWFASFWKYAPISASLSCPVKFSPFIVDFRGIKPVELEEAHHLFWDFDSSGQGLRALDFLGRSSLRFPKGSKPIGIRDGRIQYQGAPYAMSISAMELLMSCSFGGVTHRRGERYDNLVYCPHRFARMFNCDQLAPELDYRGDDRVTNSLDFRSYSPRTREESLQILLRRHLSHHRRPDGSIFYAQPLDRGTRCSVYYISWCNKAFSFLQDPSLFCAQNSVPSGMRKIAAVTSENKVAADDTGMNDKAAMDVGRAVEHSSDDKRLIVQGLPAAGAAPLGQQGKKKTSSTKHGRGKDIDVVRAHMREEKSVSPISSSDTAVPPLIESPHVSEESTGDTEIVDSGISTGALAIPQYDLDSLPSEVFVDDIHESAATLLTDMSGILDINERIDLQNVPSATKGVPMPQNTLGTGAGEKATSALTKSNMKMAPSSSDSLSDNKGSHSFGQCDGPVKQSKPEHTSGEKTASAPKRKAGAIVDTAVSKTKRKKIDEAAAAEELEVDISESKKLWDTIEQLGSKLKAEVEPRDHIDEVSLHSEFNAGQPVTLPKVIGGISPRYAQYIYDDLKRLQSVIKEQPLNREKVISEVDGNLELWGGWFKDKSPPPEVQKLMNGFIALKETLSKDPQLLVASVISKRDQAREKAVDFKTSYGSVVAACATLSKTSKAIEGQLMFHERQIKENSARAQALQAQIAELTDQLKGEASRDREVALKEQLSDRLVQHDERLSKATVLESQLKDISTRDHSQLQSLDETIASFTDLDENGFSKHTHSLLDFFMACTLES